MNGKKIVGIMLVALLLVALSPVPTSAGPKVRCRSAEECPGLTLASFDRTLAPAHDGRQPADVVFDSLKWVFPSRVIAYLRGLTGSGRF